MDNTYKHIHQLSNDLLAKKVDELARRHVGEDQEVLLEIARRLRVKPREIFNDEAFSTL
jgi:hypothetical protein